MSGQLLEVTIDRLGNRVGGVALRSGAPAVFIRGALPGERVRCSITRRRGNHLEADLVEIIESSEDRVEPFCPVYGICGGCSIQHLSYPSQLEWKGRWVEYALRSAGLPAERVDHPVASPADTGYRNIVSFDIVDGRPGLHRFRGDPFPVDDCPLLNSGGRKLLAAVSSLELMEYRRIAVRAAHNTETSMLELRGGPPPAAELSSGIGARVAWETADGWKAEGESMVEIINGIEFMVPPGGFFQVNTPAAEKLVSIVVSMTGSPGSALDLYGGPGTFGIPIAQKGGVVESVERNPKATGAGKWAARRAGIETIAFHNGHARGYLTEAINRKKRFDTVVVDPPRKGLGPRIAKLVSRLGAEKIIHVGCDPFAMARDLRILVRSGYGIESVIPIDLFPHTDHIESVALLSPGLEGGTPDR